MPSTTIIGKKGGGKSYYALLHYIIPELVHGDRVICTTLALKLPELSGYLARKYPNKDIDVNKRVRLLSREEGRRFWLHRQHGVNLQDVSDRDYDEGRNPDYSSVAHLGGILYVMDEVHVDFDARNWAKIGRGLTYYNSQERKLCDDQVFITQFLSLVDKRVKDFSQEFVECRNYMYEKFLTVLRKGSSMKARHYPFPPTGMMRELPDEAHTYRISPDLAECYDTTQGIGFKGAGKADTKSKKKGLPWWVIFLTAPLAMWALTFAVDKGTKFAAGTSGGKALANAANIKTGSTTEAASPFLPAPMNRPVVQGEKRTPVQEVYVRGVVRSGPRVNAFLSDGRTLVEPNYTEPASHWGPDAVVSVARNGITTANGRFYPMLVVERAQAAREVVKEKKPEPKPEPIPEYRGEALFEPNPAFGVITGGLTSQNAGNATQGARGGQPGVTAKGY